MEIRRRILPLRFKEYYEKSNEAVSKMILSEKPQNQSEINIKSHYRRSTYTLGNYVTLDWEHRKDIKDLINKIDAYSKDPSRKRPMNILMLAEPGSGKSYFIKCLAQKMSSTGVSAVNFNMANLRSIDDFIQPLEAVRNLKVLDHLPILFLDEFDSSPDNFPLLLPLLWDGELHIGDRDLKLGKLVIIISGSDPQIDKVMKAVKSMQIQPLTDGSQKSNGKSNKLVDLLSRINGGVFEIPKLDEIKKGRDRRVDKVCVTISLIQERFGPYLQLVPWCLLHFVAISQFRYGVRSISHLVDLIPWEEEKKDRLLIDNLQLPLDSEKKFKNSSLAYHLIDDGGPEAIVEKWNEFSLHHNLVRFKSAPEEEEL